MKPVGSKRFSVQCCSALYPTGYRPDLISQFDCGGLCLLQGSEHCIGTIILYNRMSLVYDSSTYTMFACYKLFHCGGQ